MCCIDCGEIIVQIEGGMQMTKQQILQELPQISFWLRKMGYESPALIGQGGFSGVFRVRKISTGQFCACKISREQEMLEREGRLMCQISHPLFPVFYDFRQEEGIGFLFMEWIPGGNLGDLLALRGRMSERQITRTVRKLAEGLCYLHERSIPVLFRDLKPENIIIREDGEIKLLDLGSACQLDTSADARTGTYGYAAPEQWGELQRVGFHSDVYALGQVMKRMMGSGEAGREYRAIRELVADCTREDIAERIPNMRVLLYRLKTCEEKNRKGIRLFGGKQNTYIFQKNILKF